MDIGKESTNIKRSSLLKTVSKLSQIHFIGFASGVDPIKLFGVVNLLTIESYIFSQHRKIMATLMQWSSLQKSVSKFMPKKFYEIGSWSQSLKKFWCKFTNSFCKLDHFSKVSK